jgi:hypothetical protein
MKEIRFQGDIYTIRWPWRVREHDCGFSASLPWWGRPVAMVMRWCGRQLIATRRDDEWHRRDREWQRKIFAAAMERNRKIYSEA